MSTVLSEISQPKLRYRDLRQFLDLLRREGELHEITVPVDPELEITEIYDRIVKKEGPALLFREVKGSSIPLVINLFGSRKRMNLALGAREIEDVVQRINQFLEVIHIRDFFFQSDKSLFAHVSGWFPTCRFSTGS